MAKITHDTVESTNVDEGKAERRENFERIARLRMSNALDKIRIVGNLTNTANYEYHASDIDKMEAALNAKVAEVMKEFRGVLAGHKAAAVKEEFEF